MARARVRARGAGAMNNADIFGIVCIVLGLLLVIPALYASSIFLIIAGAVLAAGIVLIITGGSMCRNKQDVKPQKRPLYAEAVPKLMELEVERKTDQALEPPPLTGMAL